MNKVKILVYGSNSNGKEIQEEINLFIKDRNIVSVTAAIASGTILGGGSIIYTILYKEK